MEERADQPISNADIPPATDFVTICSWCNRMKADDEVWTETDLELLPKITHGMCGDCYSEVSATLQS